MAYLFVPFPMTLDDPEGHSLNAELIKCNSTNICATFVRCRLLGWFNVRFGGKLALSTVLLVFSPRSAESPTVAAAAGTPLPERTLDCITELPTTEGSVWPLEPLRVVPTVRRPTDPEIPGPPPKGTDSGPASSVDTDWGPLATVSCDLTENSVIPATCGGNVVRFDVRFPRHTSLIALERVKCAIITDYENGAKQRYFFIVPDDGGAIAQAKCLSSNAK